MRNKPSTTEEIDALWAKNIPFINHSIQNTQDLSDASLVIANAIEEAEQNIRYGVSDLIPAHWPYHRDYNHLKIRRTVMSPSVNPIILECPKRDEWFDFAISKFKSYLAIPEHLWKLERNGELYTTSNGVSITLEAMLRQRYWGIAFHAESESLDAIFARAYLREAVSKLISDLWSINMLCEQWPSNSKSLEQLSFTYHKIGNQFEKLILCILNHESKIVVPSAIYGDVYEWSDMKVVRERIYQANIQVKFTHLLRDQQMASHNPKSAKTIILSPYTLAVFIEENFNDEIYGCSWAEFLAIFPQQPRSTLQLSAQLYKLFLDVLKMTRTHPMSPVCELPYQILLLVHLFVASSTVNLKAQIDWKKAAIRAAKSINSGLANPINSFVQKDVQDLTIDSKCP